jgi:hypothetical protein
MRANVRRPYGAPPIWPERSQGLRPGLQLRRAYGAGWPPRFGGEEPAEPGNSRGTGELPRNRRTPEEPGNSRGTRGTPEEPAELPRNPRNSRGTGELPRNRRTPRNRGTPEEPAELPRNRGTPEDSEDSEDSEEPGNSRGTGELPRNRGTPGIEELQESRDRADTLVPPFCRKQKGMGRSDEERRVRKVGRRWGLGKSRRDGGECGLNA